MGMRQGMMGGPLFQPPQHLVNQTKEDLKTEASKEQEKKDDQSTVKEVTSNMVEVLSTSTNPKHRNSKFLKFLNKLNHGAYTLENDQLVKHEEKIKEFRAIDLERREREALEDAKREAEEVKRFAEEETKEANEHSKTDDFRNILEGDEEITMEKYNELMQEWMQGGAEMENMNKLMEEWGKTIDQEHELKMPLEQGIIQFD
jgi:hypothetical protein